MFTFVTFLKLTEKGQTIAPDEAAKVLATTKGIAEAYGGKVLQIWATTGRYDFVSLSEYSDPELAFRARTKMMELGLFHLESASAFPIETFLAAVQDSKVNVPALV